MPAVAFWVRDQRGARTGLSCLPQSGCRRHPVRARRCSDLEGVRAGTGRVYCQIGCPLALRDKGAEPPSLAVEEVDRVSGTPNGEPPRAEEGGC